MRYYDKFVIFGTSDGYVHIMESQTLEEVYRFQAHFPIHYENEKDRELFGSLSKIYIYVRKLCGDLVDYCLSWW